MRTRRVFIDTEFLNRGADHPLSLISIGMVDDQHNEFYAINADAPLGAMWRDEFIRDVVWPQLPLPVVTSHGFGGIGGSILEWDSTNSQSEFLMPQQELRAKALEFLTRGSPDLELWGDYCAFDMVLMSQLFGPFKDVPSILPMYMNDLQQMRRLVGDVVWAQMREATVSELPLVEHHALVDAATVKDQFDWLMKPYVELNPSDPLGASRLVEVPGDPSTEEVRRLPEEISRVVDTFLETPEIGEVRQRPLLMEEEEFSRVRNDYDEIYSDGMTP